MFVPLFFYSWFHTTQQLQTGTLQIESHHPTWSHSRLPRMGSVGFWSAPSMEPFQATHSSVVVRHQTFFFLCSDRIVHFTLCLLPLILSKDTIEKSLLCPLYILSSDPHRHWSEQSHAMSSPGCMSLSCTAFTYTLSTSDPSVPRSVSALLVLGCPKLNTVLSSEEREKNHFTHRLQLQPYSQDDDRALLPQGHAADCHAWVPFWKAFRPLQPKALALCISSRWHITSFCLLSKF